MVATISSGDSPRVSARLAKAQSRSDCEIGLGNPLPTTASAFQTVFGGYVDAYLVELNQQGVVVYGSYLGGSGADFATGIAVDAVGDVYVAGYTGQSGSSPSLNFPATPFGYQPHYGGGLSDGFVSKFPLGAPQGISISGITPSAGGNAGTVSPQIFGAGFHAGSTVQMACSGQTIAGTNVSPSGNGRLLTATFRLGGVPAGNCNITVKDPDGTSATLSSGFNVTQGGAPNVLVYKVGTPAIRHVAHGPAASSTYYVTLTNAGDVDATSNLLTESLDSPFSLFSMTPPGAADTATMNTDRTAVWFVQNLAAGESKTFSYSASVTPSTAVGTPLVGGPICSILDIGAEFSCYATTCPVARACGLVTVLCPLGGPPNPLCDSALLGCWVALEGCPSSVITSCIQQKESTCNQWVDQLYGDSRDPNNLEGPGGFGNQHWISATELFVYGISFENDANATAPAKQVVVTLPFGNSVDPLSVRLLGITIPNGNGSGFQVPIASNAINPMAGTNLFATAVDLRPTQNLLVTVTVGFSPTSKMLISTFSSIDPSTGLPPVNAGVGFLPPGVGANMFLGVRPKPGIPTGSLISEQGTVQFDNDTAINTPMWTNAVAATAPVSHVLPLATTQSCQNFRVSWSGTDVGSGLGGLTIYTSDNGGPFTAWLPNTTATSGTFAGTVGHTYEFYSIASDLTGNVEARVLLKPARLS